MSRMRKSIETGSGLVVSYGLEVDGEMGRVKAKKCGAFYQAYMIPLESILKTCISTEYIQAFSLLLLPQ